ncbi:MAG: nickel pincer cofactor biosynthesis protein LarB, partial [Gemmatimonadota bacterium]
MTRERVRRLLEDVAAGRRDPDAALRELAWLPVEPVYTAGDGDGASGVGKGGGVASDGSVPGVPFARIDHHRVLRQGHPEVVLCEGKTTEQVMAICERVAERGGGFLATRADETVRDRLTAAFPEAEMNELARTVHLPGDDFERGEQGRPVLVVSAGTSDLPVAEEAVVTTMALGQPVERLYDVGVAGLHRLLERSEALRRAAVVIVVAGMEGALASVVGGLVAAPVVAVPTSVGYGASFGGLAALLGMLNTCAAGVVVTNIDNGFGAAC